MSNRNKALKKRGKGGGEEDEAEQLTKLQKSVLSWLKKNVPVKKTKFSHSHVVQYFSAGKALDALMKDSPWCVEKAKEGSELRLEYREQAIDLMAELLRHKMFHRAKKIPVADKKKKKEETDGEASLPPSPQARNRKGKKGETGVELAKGKGEEREKKKRKIRLEMHNDQVFLDGNDAYVWLYDPTPWYYYLAGGAIVLGIIAVCLFPLWPMEARQGVYYLSVAAAGFLVFIIVLAIIKYILFLLCFILTGGKLKLWIFPNLTEDVGFLESFWPMYVYTYDKPKRDRDSDDEDSSDEEDEEKEEGEGAQDGDGEGSESGKGEGEEEEQEELEDKADDDISEKSSSDGAEKFEIIN